MRRRSSPETIRLVADVGGTRPHRCLSADWGCSNMRFANDLFPSMPALFDEYRRRTSLSASRMLLAIALPETSLTLKMTNRAWHVDPHELRQQSRLRQLYVVNDFAAAVAAVPRLSDTQLQTVQPGTESAGPIVLLGPGTTGIAAALRIDDRWCVLPSEAGHMSVGSGDGKVDAIVDRARARHGRVSWERLLSGPGLAWLDVELNGTALMSAADVAQRALSGHQASLETLHLFSHCLGEFAGDVCLAMRALGGVYLTGGVLDGMGHGFSIDKFLSGFRSKGRFEAMLRQVAVWRVLAHDLGLLGAVAIVKGDAIVPGLKVCE
jgi:glucokinase